MPAPLQNGARNKGANRFRAALPPVAQSPQGAQGETNGAHQTTSSTPQPQFRLGETDAHRAREDHLPDPSPNDQVSRIEAAARAENEIELATRLAKVSTMGLKAAKDILG